MSSTFRYDKGEVENRLVAFTCSLYSTLELSFVSLYNHLLFLAKTNKENDNNIDFSLSIGQNLKKYSSILD
jgi:hypothetical protein